MFVARDWSFTVSNPSCQLDPSSWSIQPVFLVYQLQILPSSSVPYYQGYVQFSNALRLLHVKEVIGFDANLEVARGSPFQHHALCTRPDSRAPGSDSGPFIYGCPPDSRALSLSTPNFSRRVLTSSCSGVVVVPASASVVADDQMIEEVVPPAQRVVRVPYFPKRTSAPFVHVIVGPSGSGKTRYATTSYPGAYYKGPFVQSWTGYRSQSEVILDNFDGWLSFDGLLRLCSTSHFLVGTAFGRVYCPASVVVIVSHFLPESWYVGQNIFFPSFVQLVSKWSVFASATDCRDYSHDFSLDGDDITGLGRYSRFLSSVVSLNSNLTSSSIGSVSNHHFYLLSRSSSVISSSGV